MTGYRSDIKILYCYDVTPKSSLATCSKWNFNLHRMSVPRVLHEWQLVALHVLDEIHRRGGQSLYLFCLLSNFIRKQLAINEAITMYKKPLTFQKPRDSGHGKSKELLALCKYLHILFSIPILSYSVGV